LLAEVQKAASKHVTVVVCIAVARLTSARHCRCGGHYRDACEPVTALASVGQHNPLFPGVWEPDTSNECFSIVATCAAVNLT
jgi:ABC-type cobalt transport system substrate-binding protein